MNRIAFAALAALLLSAPVAQAANPILCVPLKKFEQQFMQQGDGTILWEGKALDGTIYFLLQPHLIGKFLLGRLKPNGKNVCFFGAGTSGLVLPYTGDNA